MMLTWWCQRAGLAILFRPYFYLVATRLHKASRSQVDRAH
uniref:Uncharacterized protein n=1 Tax=Arundo donax TaxID=35708 RepID=A0A0A8ZMT4_ARUDO